MHAEDIINIIMHVVLISSFIAVFFFTYGSQIEQEIVQSQAENIVKVFTEDISLIIPNSTKPIIKAGLQERLKSPDFSKEDKEVEDHNKELLINATKIIVMFAVVGITVILVLASIYNVELTDIVTRNIIILAFVGLTEYLFATYIIKNYITADPNFVKLSLVKALKYYANN